MIDHLLYNAKKWFAVDDGSTTLKANGKNYQAIPDQVLLPAGTIVHTIANGVIDYDVSNKVQVALCATVSCDGIIGDMYSVTGSIDIRAIDIQPDGIRSISLTPYDGISLVNKSDVQIVSWGGKHTLLTHLYQLLRHVFTFRNGVRAWL